MDFPRSIPFPRRTVIVTQSMVAVLSCVLLDEQIHSPQYDAVDLASTLVALHLQLLSNTVMLVESFRRSAAFHQLRQQINAVEVVIEQTIGIDLLAEAEMEHTSGWFQLSIVIGLMNLICFVGGAAVQLIFGEEQPDPALICIGYLLWIGMIRQCISICCLPAIRYIALQWRLTIAHLTAFSRFSDHRNGSIAAFCAAQLSPSDVRSHPPASLPADRRISPRFH